MRERNTVSFLEKQRQGFFLQGKMPTPNNGNNNEAG